MDYVVGIVACQVVVFVRNSSRESWKSELILSVQLDSINQNEKLSSRFTSTTHQMLIPERFSKRKTLTQQKFSTSSFEPAIIKPLRGTLAKADGRIEQIGPDARTAQLTWRRTSEER